VDVIRPIWVWEMHYLPRPDNSTADRLRPANSTDGDPISGIGEVVCVGLPPVPDFTGCPGFAPCCPASRQDQPRDAKCPGFQGAVKMETILKKEEKNSNNRRDISSNLIQNIKR